jgi:hypothetical protein
MPDGVQPDAGQGTDGGGPYDSYLQFVPEARHGEAVEHLQGISKPIERQQEEAATFRKQWEPYAESGILDYPPEDAQALFGWHQGIAGDPAAAQQWWESFGRENGWTLAAEEAQAEEDLEAQGFSAEQAQAMVAEAVAPLQQQYEELAFDRNADIEADAMNAEIGRLAKEMGLGELSNEQRAMVYDLGMPFVTNEKGEELPVGDTSWVKEGLERFKAIHSEAQRLFVNEKAEAPAGTVTKGGVEQGKKTLDWNEAGKQARELMRQSLRT